MIINEINNFSRDENKPRGIMSWFKKKKPPIRDRRKGETRLILIGPDGICLEAVIHQRANYVWVALPGNELIVTGVSVEQQVHPDSPVKLEWKEVHHVASK